MNALIAAVRVIDRIKEVVGRAVAFLTLGAVLVCLLVVVLRYVFSIGFVWMQELYVWHTPSSSCWAPVTPFCMAGMCASTFSMRA